MEVRDASTRSSRLTAHGTDRYLFRVALTVSCNVLYSVIVSFEQRSQHGS